jgi:hypothetical protein
MDPATPTVSQTVGRCSSREVSREDHLRGWRLSREKSMVNVEVKSWHHVGLLSRIASAADVSTTK